MSGEKELASWVDILLEAAREAGFANRMSLYYLHTFSKAIRKELESRATPPGFEMVPEGTMAKLLEASNHLAWAAEVEIQVGRRPRAFVRQHRVKVRFWIDSVRAILSAHRADMPKKEGE